MKRFKVNVGKDKRMFSKTAAATKRINYDSFNMRGGIRL